MARTKQCKCATNSTAAHIRFVADLDHHVPVKEGSVAAGAATDDDSASACDSVPPNEFSLSTSRNMDKSSLSFSSDNEGPSLPLGAERSMSSGRLRISECAHRWSVFQSPAPGMRNKIEIRERQRSMGGEGTHSFLACSSTQV
jgi:hypothetical protein